MSSDESFKKVLQRSDLFGWMTSGAGSSLPIFVVFIFLARKHSLVKPQLNLRADGRAPLTGYKIQFSRRSFVKFGFFVELKATR
jgi:hypothetical protein